MSSLKSKLLALFFLISFFFIFPADVVANEHPKPQVMIVSQVRGSECCDVGSVVALQRQLDLAVTQQVPLYFAVRWDALNNSEMIGVLRNAQQQSPHLVQVGILVEITPGLARASGVPYSGNDQDWYQAQHVFPLGYELADREKIIDRLVDQFFQVFNKKPTFSVGWMIDTPTLRYLRQEHGVMLHEITREQWATDSYHLYGGPAHFPYQASDNWAFIPSSGADSSLPLIIRQTVTDPLYNYGDSSNAFTSQPNDFTLDGKSFEYFQRLVDQALGLDGTAQLPRGWAVLGIETSMNEYYQELFSQQVAYIAKLRKKDVVETPTLQQIITDWNQPALSLYQGTELTDDEQTEVQQSWWITAPHYRVRLRQRANQLFIDDVRLYDEQLVDYYTTHQAENHAFWIAPYILDGSLWYEKNVTKRNWWQKLFFPPAVPDFTPEILSDLVSSPSRIELPPIAAQKLVRVVQKGNQIVFEYDSAGQGQIALTFSANDWDLIWKKGVFFPATHVFGETPLELETDHTQKTVLQWQIGAEVSHQLAIDCKPSEQRCHFSTTIHPELFDKLQAEQYPFMLPESKTRELSATKTLLYAHNQYAIAGRNPARLVVIPYDEFGYPTVLEAEITIETDPATVDAKLVSAGKGEKIQFVDVSSQKSQAVAVTIVLSDELSKTTTVYFAPNCASSWRFCLTHPRQTWWFIQTVARDKFRSLVLQESQ